MDVPSQKKMVPSGKLTKHYGKSPFLMGKYTISMAIFNSYVSLPEGMSINFWQILTPQGSKGSQLGDLKNTKGFGFTWICPEVSGIP